MEASAGLVAGSHNRNELVVIRRDGESALRPVQHLNGQICQICGDTVGLNDDNELFVACNECAFPMCKTCYDYERREGSQVCPQCKTRLKRHKGCARVDGDEDEDGVDDLENEFKDLGGDDDAESVLHSHLSYGRGRDYDMPHSFHAVPNVPLLTNGQMVLSLPTTPTSL